MTTNRVATRNMRGAAMVASLVALVGAAGCAGSAQRDPSAPPSAPRPRRRRTPATGDLPDGPLAAGTYRIPRSAWSVADVTVTVPEGWGVQYGHILVKHPATDKELGIAPVVVDDIYGDACGASDDVVEVGPSVDDLVAALQAQTGPAVSDPVATSIGGHAGRARGPDRS